MQPPPNHVTMLQIDCEVMNTRLLHVKEDAIPSQMNRLLNNHDKNNGKTERSHNSQSTFGNKAFIPRSKSGGSGKHRRLDSHTRHRQFNESLEVDLGSEETMLSD